MNAKVDDGAMAISTAEKRRIAYMVELVCIICSGWFVMAFLWEKRTSCCRVEKRKRIEGKGIGSSNADRLRSEKK